MTLTLGVPKGTWCLLILSLLQYATFAKAGLELNDAVKLGSVDRVAALLAKGSSVSTLDSIGWTPLHNAANTGNVVLAKLLLENHAKIDAKDARYGKTALHLAAHNGEEKVIETLLEAGAASDATDVNGQTPLHLATWNGHIGAALLLLKHGADINAQDKYGSTPLRLAAIQNYGEVVKALLVLCPDLRFPDNKGVTVEEFAKKKELRNILSIFEEHRRTPCSRHKLQNVARRVHLTHNAETCKRGEKFYPDEHVPYSWRVKETPAGETMNIPCPAGTSGTATWTCGLDGRWQRTPNLSKCHSLFFSGWQEVMATNNVTAAEIITTIASKLRDTEKDITLAPGDLITIGGILEKLQDTHLQDFERMKSGIESWKLAMRYLKGVMESVDTMLTKPALWWGLNQQAKYTTFTRLQNSVKFATTTLAARQMGSFQEFSVYSLTTRVMNRPLKYFKSILLTFDHPKFNETTFALPFNFYDTYQGDEGAVKVAFVAFTDLHCTVNTVPCSPDEVDPVRDLPALGQVNTPIVGATIGDGSTWHAPLDERVEVRFQHIYNGNDYQLGERTCVWWDTSSNNWATDGCRLADTGDHFSLCHCDHLTNLAVIMDINGIIDNKGAMYQVLRCVTIVGCVVSVVSLASCIICFLAFKDIREDASSLIHANLCFCLMISEMVLLGGLGSTYNMVTCNVVGALLHYFFLATFIWSAIDALHVYIKFVKVLKSKTSPVKYYMIVGYLIPLVYVSFTIGFARAKGYSHDKVCWLSTQGLIWSFAGPLAAILLFNGSAFLLAIYFAWCREPQQSIDYKNSSISSSSTKSTKSKEKGPKPGFWQNLSLEQQKRPSSASGKRMHRGNNLHDFPGDQTGNSSHQGYDSIANHPLGRKIGGSLSVLALLCLTWLSGFLYYLDGSHALALIFTLLNSMQGVGIFVIHIVLNSRIMQEVRSVLK